jgi:hypothetical protein
MAASRSYGRKVEGGSLLAILTVLVLSLCGSCTRAVPDVDTATGTSEQKTSGQKVAAGQAIVPTSDTCTLDLGWKQGDHFEYEMVKTKKQVRAGAITVDATTRTPLTVDVVAKTDTAGYLLACTFGATEFDDPKANTNLAARKMIDALAGKPVLVEVDSAGYVVSVQNWQEVKAAYENVTSTITEELRRSGADQRTIDGVTGVVVRLSTEEVIKRATTKEIFLLLAPFGKDYDGSNPTVQDELPLRPFGGSALPGKSHFTLVGFTPAPKTAIVTLSQSVEPEAMGRLARELTLSDANGRNPEAQLPTLKHVESNGEFAVDPESGWVLRVSYERTIVLGDATQEASQEETISLRRK